MTEKCRDLLNSCRSYLCGFDGITDQIIDSHLQNWKQLKKDNLRDVYRTFLTQAKTRQSMPNTIGDIECLREVLLNFEPKEVAKAYSTHFEVIKEILGRGIQTPSPIDVTNSRNHWVIYAKTIVTSAKFLEMFASAHDFHAFVESFYCNTFSRLALPLLLKEEVVGFGFPIACDFLKESGYNGFVKPDTHLKEICRAAGITSSENDVEIFKDVVRYCEDNKMVPYEFDKLVWLVGSGNFYLINKRIRTNKQRFIDQYIKH